MEDPGSEGHPQGLWKERSFSGVFVMGAEKQLFIKTPSHLQGDHVASHQSALWKLVVKGF